MNQRRDSSGFPTLAARSPPPRHTRHRHCTVTTAAALSPSAVHLPPGSLQPVRYSRFATAGSLQPARYSTRPRAVLRNACGSTRDTP
ncbi:uncharacterized protein RMCT_3854 [Mycolicibacterium thermoresistibile]|uniref:Uncharacterized protein n=1 Tax=Mycolicibacterium thermoresistibile TaxID=1797 RepID=A0A117INI6_MYCTH|nr:uncharacterized protein RMCT_3854 [Mycolicibacterium thermoresistibile]